MNIENSIYAMEPSPEASQPLGHALGQWVQSPMGSVIAASVGVIGSFGLVLSGMWLINVIIY